GAGIRYRERDHPEDDDENRQRKVRRDARPGLDGHLDLPVEAQPTSLRAEDCDTDNDEVSDAQVRGVAGAPGPHPTRLDRLRRDRARRRANDGGELARRSAGCAVADDLGDTAGSALTICAARNLAR